VNSPYTVLRLLPLEEVLPVILKNIPPEGANSQAKVKAIVGGTEVKVSSLRLRCFALKGTTCSSCGVKATHFHIEANNRDQWHLNLYADKVMMTHDHTLARSLGGADKIENVTTMCYPCNNEKSKTES
jgi:5-methylcytosine-specific restriction endonuclease McrA